MLKAFLEKVYCTRSMNIFASLAILTQAMLMTRELMKSTSGYCTSLEEIW